MKEICAIILMAALLATAGCEKQAQTEQPTVKPPIVIGEEPGNNTGKEPAKAAEATPSTEEPKTSYRPAVAEQKEKKLIMFHNGQGPMCIQMLGYLDSFRNRCPGLQIEQHLTTDQNGRALLNQLEAEHSQSRGVSGNFGYLPITFINENAYSGFDESVRKMMEADIDSICR